MKSFSKSTIVGLTFGILLAFGIVVSAFQSPTQAPPEGNTPAPINISSGFQEKTGDLWVRALGATAGITVGGQSVCLSNGANCPPSGVPAGFVGFFNLVSCPTGWSELIGAQGRYLVGKPSGGTQGATVGTALSDQENRAIGRHTHGASDPGHSHSVHGGQFTGSQFGSIHSWIEYGFGMTGSTGVSSTGVTISEAGSVAGTNAPYIQFLICQKN